MNPVSLSIYMLGYPLLSVLLMVALGSELFINMYLNIVILLGLCTAMGGWHWWRSRGQAGEDSGMPTGIFVSSLGWWFVLPLRWSLGGSGPFATGFRMAVLFCSLLALVLAVFSNGYFLGQYNSRRKMLDEANALNS